MILTLRILDSWKDLVFARYDEYHGPGDYPQTGDEERGLAVLRAIERSKRSSYRRLISVLQALSEEGFSEEWKHFKFEGSFEE